MSTLTDIADRTRASARNLADRREAARALAWETLREHQACKRMVDETRFRCQPKVVR